MDPQEKINSFSGNFHTSVSEVISEKVAEILDMSHSVLFQLF